ncbi:MAG TPA: hypothetical protein VIN72_06360 [Lutibacter sp.]
MKKLFNSGFRFFFVVTILIGIGYNLSSEYSFHADKTVLSAVDNIEKSVFVSDIDFFEKDQINLDAKNNILVHLNLENYNFKNSFLILQASFIIWQPPKNYA